MTLAGFRHVEHGQIFGPKIWSFSGREGGIEAGPAHFGPKMCTLWPDSGDVGIPGQFRLGKMAVYRVVFGRAAVTAKMAIRTVFRRN